jgi:hypothetical protein
LNDLPELNLNNDLLKSTICTIIENIELWDNSLLLKYSDCLELIVKKIDKITSLNIKNNITNNDLYIFSNGIINIIFRYFLNIIENSESEISLYYVRGFDSIIDCLSINKNFKIDSDIIENVSLMGSFGKKTILRRYSLFFSTSFLRVKKI